MLLATPVQAQVTVFAAASLRGALEDVAEASDIEMTVSYGGSGLLARQVTQGAPADVILLANAAWMDWLEAQDLVAAGSAKTILSNRLVVVGPKTAKPFAELYEGQLLTALGDGKLALGHTQAVPAGIYTREWMENSGLWAALTPHLVETENVRAALALVARGEAALGVVYQSDAQAEAGVDVLYKVPPDTHSAIAYRVAIVAGRASEEVEDFHAFLTSPTAQDIFAAHGFLRAEATQ